MDRVIDVGKTSDKLMYLIDPLDTSDLETLEASYCGFLRYMPIDLVCMKLHCLLIHQCQKNKIWQLHQLNDVYFIIYVFIC